MKIAVLYFNNDINLIRCEVCETKAATDTEILSNNYDGFWKLAINDGSGIFTVDYVKLISVTYDKYPKIYIRDGTINKVLIKNSKSKYVEISTPYSSIKIKNSGKILYDAIKNISIK